MRFSSSSPTLYAYVRRALNGSEHELYFNSNGGIFCEDHKPRNCNFELATSHWMTLVRSIITFESQIYWKRCNSSYERLWREINLVFYVIQSIFMRNLIWFFVASLPVTLKYSKKRNTCEQHCWWAYGNINHLIFSWVWYQKIRKNL